MSIPLDGHIPSGKAIWVAGLSKIREPGDLPAIEHQRADGAFCNRLGTALGKDLPTCSTVKPAAKLGQAMTVTLHVCVTCRAGEIVPEGEACPGKKLHAALQKAGAPEGVEIVPVECLSACTRGAAIALSSKGRWSYVYGQLSEADANDILIGATDYAASSDGIVPWRERVEIFKRNSIARIPPAKDTRA